MIETFYQRPNHRFIFHLIISSENKGFVYSYITREDCVSFFSYIKKEGKYYTFCFIKKFIRKSNMKYDKNGVGVSLLKKCKPSIGQQFTKKKTLIKFFKNIYRRKHQYKGRSTFSGQFIVFLHDVQHYSASALCLRTNGRCLIRN